jgi:hypothetical protein
MKISEYIDSAWSIHATEPKRVLEEIRHQLPHVQSEEEILSLGNLIVHVAGEHLGLWLAGLELLRKLKNNPLLKDRKAMSRMVAILELGNNSATKIDNFSPSDQARILATTASALCSLGGIRLSESYLVRAENIVSELLNDDPAIKSLAMTGNNMASALEGKTDRNENETKLMIKAAKLGRIFWEKAGTWKEVERAEYRLAQTYLKSNNIELAFDHAKKCLAIVEANNNEPLELFFGLEILALTYKAQNNLESFNETLKKMDSTFKNLSDEDQKWCLSTLKNLQ